MQSFILWEISKMCLYLFHAPLLSLTPPRSSLFSPNQLHLFFPLIPHCGQFELPIYSQVWDHPVSKVNSWGGTSLKKTDSQTSPRWHRPLLAPQLGLMTNEAPHGNMVIALILCKSCVGYHSCCGFMSVEVLSFPELTCPLINNNTLIIFRQ